MVRLLNKKNVTFFADILYKILSFQASMTDFIDINNSNITPCIYAIWHSNQLCLHGIKDKKKLNILISNSVDGEIITQVVERMGFSVIRGSSGKKGCISATLQMITALKDEKCVAITVDGPQGPYHKVKAGIVKLAKETGVPIVPLVWYSDNFNFVSLPSWDKMRMVFGLCKIINLYGKPIYIDKEEDMVSATQKIREALTTLDEQAPYEFKKAKLNRLWNKKK